MTPDELNAGSEAGFVRVVGPVYESSPWIAERAWAARPFADRDDLRSKLQAVVREAATEDQLRLIRAHPDLVGHAAQSGGLTLESTREQRSAGLGELSPQEIETFQRYNAEYRERFGFPFVICARGNKKDAILAALPIRLLHTRDEEVETALAEIHKIAWLRLQDAVEDAP